MAYTEQEWEQHKRMKACLFYRDPDEPGMPEHRRDFSAEEIARIKAQILADEAAAKVLK